MFKIKFIEDIKKKKEEKLERKAEEERRKEEERLRLLEEARIKREQDRAFARKVGLIIAGCVGVIAIVISVGTVIKETGKRISSIKYFTNEENIYVGDTLDLSYEVLPKTAEYNNDDIKFEFDKQELIKEENGYKAIADGTLKVTLKYNNQNYDQKIINIQPILVEKLDIKDLEVGLNLKNTITTDIQPTNATHRNITYKVADESVAKINDGVIYGLKEGVTKVTATSEDGPETTFNVTVKNIIPESLTITDVQDKYIITDVGKLQVVSEPKEISDGKFEYVSSDPEVLEVSKDGSITTVGVGTATITATHSSGLTCSKKVEVLNYLASAIEISDPGKIYVDSSVRLKATLTPIDASNNDIKWSSSNSDVAEIDEESGVLKAYKEGVVTITAATTTVKNSIKLDILAKTQSSGTGGDSGTGGSGGSSGGMIVYVSNNNVFHTKSNCHGMKHYTEMTIGQAKAQGATACGHCAKGY